jgi:hypothetical protein
LISHKVFAKDPRKSRELKLTVTTNTNKTQPLGNGVTTSFPYSFRIFSAADLVVTRTVIATGVDTTLVLNTDYTVTGAGSYNGGNVVCTVAPAAGTRLTIRRVLSVTQGTDLRNQGAYFAENHEDVFDRLTMVDQQQQETLDRAFTFSPSEGADTQGNLPPAATRANNLLGFDADGKPVAIVPSAQSAAALQGLLAADDGVLMVGNATDERDLAASSGASLVGYANGGAAITAEDALDILYYGIANVRNPKFAGGAKGDGTTDDTAAIQAAVAASKYVYVPEGLYLHTRIVQQHQDQIFIGAGAGVSVLYCPVGYGITNFSGTDAAPVGVDWRGGLTLEKLTLRGGFAHTDDFSSPANSWAFATGRAKPFTTTAINAGLRLKQAIPYTLRGVKLENFHRGAYVSGGAAANWGDFEVSDCEYGFYGENGTVWGDSNWKITTHHWHDGRFKNCWIGIGGSDFVQCQVDKKTVIFEPCNTGIAVTNGLQNVWSGYFELCSEGIYRNGGDMGADVIDDPFFAGTPGNFWGVGYSILMDFGIGAGGKITLRDGLDTLGGGGIAVLAGKLSRPERYQGAMVFITAVTPAGGFVPSSVPLALAAPEDDTDGFFSAAAPTRLTIPSHLRNARVKLKASLSIAGDATANEVSIQTVKNGVAFNGGALFTSIFAYGAFVNLESAPVTVSAGDYFELQAAMNLSRQINGGLAQAWFSIEVVG